MVVERMQITPCFGWFDSECGSCVGYSKGSMDDRAPCGSNLTCRAFGLYLAARGQEPSTYIETWAGEEGEVLHKPTMGWGAFKRFCEELVIEHEVARTPSPAVIGRPVAAYTTEPEFIPEMMARPLKKIHRRGSYKAKKVRADRIARLVAHFLDQIYKQLEPWRRLPLGHAPAVGQVFLTDVVQTGRYLALYARTKNRDLTLAVVRYHTLRKTLMVELNVSAPKILDRVPAKFRGKFKKRCQRGRRLTTMLVDIGMEESAILAEVLGQLVRDGIIKLPAQLE